MTADGALSPDLRREIQQLVDDLLQGDVTDQQRQRLDELVAGNHEAGMYYVRAVCDAMQLRDWAQATEDTEDTVDAEAGPATDFASCFSVTSSDPDNRDQPGPAAGPVGEPPQTAVRKAGRAERFERIGRWPGRLAQQIHPRQHPVYFTAISLVLCIAFWALLVALLKPSWHTRPLAKDTAAEPTGIARLKWVDNPWWQGFQPSGREDIPAGQQLVLREGLAELHYHTGAIVILEGPAEFWVGGQEAGDRRQEAGANNSNPQSAIRNPQSNSGFLARGKLVARCGTRDSKGFTVKTPHARVTDLGTEFAVAVQDDGAAEVAVISGTVVLVGQPVGGSQGRRVRLTKDQGAFVEAGGGAIARRGKGNVPLAEAVRDRLKIRRQAAANVAAADQTPIDASANLITNGSFETTTLNPVGSDKAIPTGDDLATMPGWNVGSNYPAFYHLMSAFDAIGTPSGKNFINMTKTSDGGTLSQRFAVTAGTDYTVSWYARERTKNNHHEAQVTLGAGSATGQLSLATSDLTPTRWKQFSFSFIPDTSTTATLTFTVLNASGYGSFLDNVSVTTPAAPAPEAATTESREFEERGNRKAE